MDYSNWTYEVSKGADLAMSLKPIQEDAVIPDIDQEEINNICLGIGKVIRKRRRELKITSLQLAEILGCDRRTIEGIENGKKQNIGFLTFVKICYALDLDIFGESKALVDFEKATTLADELRKVFKEYE